MMLHIHFEATLLQRLVYPFFFIKSRKRELFFAFAAKINFSDTGTFSKIIFDHMQVFKKHIRTYITALMLIIFSKKQKFCVNLHATYKLLRFPKIVPWDTLPKCKGKTLMTLTMGVNFRSPPHGLTCPYMDN